jgi:probable F420-dependent oxidoreductase
MRFNLQLGFSHYTQFQEIARTAEAAGWSSIGMPDSYFFPKQSESIYPYADTNAVRGYIEAMPFLEPMVAMTWMAAATNKIKFYPSVMKIPTRQPLVLAKAVSSLAVISENRIMIGAGLSPWKEDFTYNGVDYTKRGRLMDECIAILRGVMSGDFFEYHSENFNFGPLKMNPVPTRPVPIIVGGHSKPALLRAATLGDGWVSANTDFDTLAGLIRDLTGLREAHGTRQRNDFQIHGFDVAAGTPADFRRMEDIGVTDACVAPWSMDPTATPQVQLDAIRRFGDEVIAKM